ncbi:transporter substrate-binding domain-containing protein [Alloscardovia criceti]|uniref:transporter substrate-binding domain-containing protein n=1 Tax=Alloscardovia criceti TaxID=356828 RepID=UPI0003821643|nr:transporter substrate-binding domain-containing protein [Alloscardovia criceti]
MKVKKLLASLASVLLSASLAACGVEFSDVVGPTINIGIAQDRPGLSFARNASASGGSVSGFSVYIAQQIALDLGYSDQQINWIGATDSQQDQFFETGKIDMFVGASEYSQKASSTHNVEFAGPFLVSPMGVMVRKDQYEQTQSVNDGLGKRVCIVRGELADDWNDEQIATFKQRVEQVFEQDSYAQCMSAIATATVDSIVGNEIALEQYMFSTRGQQFVLSEIPDEVMSYGVSVPEGDIRLQAKIQRKLASLVADGSWDRAIASIKEQSEKTSIQQLQAPVISEPPEEPSIETK